jgi:hypothetical protein
MAQRTLGIEPSLNDWLSADKRLHTLNSMGHNWWSSIVFQAGVASLAVMNEVPEAKNWAEDVLQSADEWFSFSGSVRENKPSWPMEELCIVTVITALTDGKPMLTF